jgi:hypothetical protein
MKKNTLFVIASLLILVSLFLIVFGFQNDSRWVWLAGLIVIAIAMGLSLTTRWVEDSIQKGNEQDESQ